MADPKTQAGDPVEMPQALGATFAERAAASAPAAPKASKKQVDDNDAENKSIDSGESKAKRPARKKS